MPYLYHTGTQTPPQLLVSQCFWSRARVQLPQPRSCLGGSLPHTRTSRCLDDSKPYRTGRTAHRLTVSSSIPHRCVYHSPAASAHPSAGRPTSTAVTTSMTGAATSLSSPGDRATACVGVVDHPWVTAHVKHGCSVVDIEIDLGALVLLRLECPTYQCLWGGKMGNTPPGVSETGDPSLSAVLGGALTR